MMAQYCWACKGGSFAGCSQVAGAPCGWCAAARASTLGCPQAGQTVKTWRGRQGMLPASGSQTRCASPTRPRTGTLCCSQAGRARRGRQGMLPVSGSQETLRLFHALVHKDARVEVGAWRAEGDGGGGGNFRLRRTVTYRAPMRGPAWFRAMCGARPRRRPATAAPAPRDARPAAGARVMFLRPRRPSRQA